MELTCIKTSIAKIPLAFSFKLDWFVDADYSEAACAGSRNECLGEWGNVTPILVVTVLS